MLLFNLMLNEVVYVLFARCELRVASYDMRVASCELCFAMSEAYSAKAWQWAVP